MPKKRILIVEDNALNREILSEILMEKYEVLEAENGQDALDILKQYREDIALILLDVMMPVMDGFTFLDRVKEDTELSLIPVIVMTQSDSEADEIAALAHGATDFVPKPYRPQVILHRIASIINLRESACMLNQLRYDRLTGLYSKEFFYQKVRELLRNDPNGEYIIVCSNIENFKLYNDTFGMAAGDRLLQILADIMQQRAGDELLCGRLSADRFACVHQRGMVDLEGCIAQVEEELAARSQVNNVVMKWGVFQITDRTIPVELMCDRVLLAVDSIKGKYNQNLAVYDDTLRSKLLREQAITETMESALTQQQFSIYLQPKYSLSDESLIGAEALVRWTHPELGVLSPGAFIPLFEKNGFITRLDQYVWERCCALLREWMDKGYDPVPVSVNVSRADIYQINLTDTLMDLIKKYDLEPASLHLEITESAYTENPGQIIRTVDQLRELGFVIELDDFGSGYSSLNMLNQMKLDILKLDMQFVQSEMDKPAEHGILRSIIGLAHWMQLSVVAEGVETREQVERLRNIGCDYAQGYYFERPMPAYEFGVLLEFRPARSAAGEREQPAGELLRKSLLVVDESAECRQLYRKAFEGEYELLEAADAAQAMSCLMNHGREISTVVLSLTLPDQGSAAVLNSIRGNLQTWQVPVLAAVPRERGVVQQDYELNVEDVSYKPRDEICLNCVSRRVEWMHTLKASQKREQHLREEVYRDYLTGLLNRRGLEFAADTLQEKHYPVALYLFDLDNLKYVNEVYGHEVGDTMLRAFSEQLRSLTRDGDILCRYGGDEFVVILRSMQSGEEALQKGREICDEFRKYRISDECHGACSGGIVICEREGASLSGNLDLANHALYRAKQENEGGCCLWDAADD